nr:MAG TPA: YopX protein [Caudoviricetes sp.]
MREIKFRAWDILKQRWSNYKINDGTVYFMDKNTGVWYGTYNRRYKDFNLMQYTGLKDKNNKEIYEGDIFHIGSKKILYVVEWIDCGLKGKQIRNGSWIGLDFWKKDIEIVGNIYENPELLGE